MTLKTPSASDPANACAFVTTAFGFGPISKAVSIASEIKSRDSDLQTHYFGAGISYEYAMKSGAFDSLALVDVESSESLEMLLPQLAHYRAVFSILNLDLLPLWRPELPALYFVDSLAWMWPALPAGTSNLAAYFVQDYLLPAERIAEWTKECRLVLVPSIETASTTALAPPAVKDNRLLVNFSGCANPFAPSDLYEEYVETLASAILAEAETRYDRISFCCNERLAEYLRRRLCGVPAIEVGHYAHEDFLRLLVSSALVLSAPGITVTLEALASQTPVGFLLPQNDSQALMSERYLRLLGEDSCMAFSRFGTEFSFQPFLPAKESVASALTLLRKILKTRSREIRSMIRGLLALPSSYSIAKLRENTIHEWQGTGQEHIVSHVLAQLTAHGDRN